MAILFLAGVTTAYWAEARGNPLLHGVNQHVTATQAGGNMEGKEVRFGITNSALFATVTTDASCGAINSWHDSFTPLGGMVPLVNIMLSEVIFGGVGAGMYGILIYVVLAVFIAGLMVGRTPEYLGKKIEAYDVKMAMLVALVFPLVILVFTGFPRSTALGHPASAIPGRTGFTQMLYSFTSGAGNNGSAFAGLNTNTLWYNTTLGFDHADRPFLHDHPHAGDCRKSGAEEVCSAVAGNVSRDHAAVQRAADRRDSHCRRADIFPRTKPGADSRAPADGGW